MYKKVIKRFLDIFCSLVFIGLFWWLYLLIAIMIKIRIGSPIIFTQRRPGLHEKVFMMYKFRSMTDDRDENGQLLPDEKRLTKLGKILRETSLDEIPEIFNVLKGDMSLVGPRPLLERYLGYYTEAERHRHDVRPGITGLAQVNGRNLLTWDKRLEKDLEYVKKVSLFLDIKIIFLTIKKVLKKADVVVVSDLEFADLDEERKKWK